MEETLTKDGLIVIEFRTVVRKGDEDRVINGLYHLCGGNGLTVNDLGPITRPLTEDEWKETKEQLDIRDQQNPSPEIERLYCQSCGKEMLTESGQVCAQCFERLKAILA